MRKYTIITPDYTTTFFGFCPEDGGFFPDADTGQPARDSEGNPVIACHEDEIGIEDAGRLRAMYDDHMGMRFHAKAYRWFLERYLALDDELVEELVLLERIKRLPR